MNVTTLCVDIQYILHWGLAYWHHSWAEFKRQMSKTRLQSFKFRIGGFYGNVNEGWDESCVLHHIPTDKIYSTDC